eukprot:UN22510
MIFIIRKYNIYNEKIYDFFKIYTIVSIIYQHGNIKNSKFICWELCYEVSISKSSMPSLVRIKIKLRSKPAEREKFHSRKIFIFFQANKSKNMHLFFKLKFLELTLVCFEH